MREHLLLHLHSTSDGAIDAVVNDQKGIARGIDDPTPMFGDRGVDQIAPQCPQAL
jgi:hypothetical protein